MLSLKGRQVLLCIHLVLSAITIGGLVAMLALVLVCARITDGDELAGATRTLFALHEYLILPASFGFIYTGLGFSLFTKWGFFRFRWIAAKWIALVVLSLLSTLLLAPAVNGMSALADSFRADAPGDPLFLQARSTVLIVGVLELALLLATVALSVFKPWGQRAQRFRLGRRTLLALGATLAIGVAAWLLIQNATVQTYRTRSIPPVDLTTVADGTYRGEASDAGFTYLVDVTVAGQQIANIRIVRNRSSAYALLAQGAAQKVLRTQRNDVDAVSGATTTSKVLLLAIEDALRRGQQR